MSKKKSNMNDRVTLRLEPEVAEHLRDVAKQEGKTLSTVVREAMNPYFKLRLGIQS